MKKKSLFSIIVAIILVSSFCALTAFAEDTRSLYSEYFSTKTNVTLEDNYYIGPDVGFTMMNLGTNSSTTQNFTVTLEQKGLIFFSKVRDSIGCTTNVDGGGYIFYDVGSDTYRWKIVKTSSGSAYIYGDAVTGSGILEY